MHASCIVAFVFNSLIFIVALDGRESINAALDYWNSGLMHLDSFLSFIAYVVSSYTYLTCAHTIVDMVMVLCADRCIILGLN